VYPSLTRVRKGVPTIKELGRFINTAASMKDNRAHAVACVLSLVLLLR